MSKLSTPHSTSEGKKLIYLISSPDIKQQYIEARAYFLLYRYICEKSNDTFINDFFQTHNINKIISRLQDDFKNSTLENDLYIGERSDKELSIMKELFLLHHETKTHFKIGSLRDVILDIVQNSTSKDEKYTFKNFKSDIRKVISEFIQKLEKNSDLHTQIKNLIQWVEAEVIEIQKTGN